MKDDMNYKAQIIYNGITEIDDDLILSAQDYAGSGYETDYAGSSNTIHRTKISRRPGILRRAVTIAACVCLCFCTAIPVLAMNDNDFAYGMLYRLFPQTAQKLKPVHESCVDKGIELGVEYAGIRDGHAEILLTLQDLEGDRIDGSADLFDSYSIHTPYDITGGCYSLGYDYDGGSGKAAFSVDITSEGRQLVSGDKFTFSMNRILTHKTETEMELDMIDLGNVSETNNVYRPELCGGSGADLDLDSPEWPDMLRPDEDHAIEIVPGAYYTGSGIVDGKLHIQIRYIDTLNTDNHGLISVIGPDGKRIDCALSMMAWAESEGDLYYEYVFDVPQATLNDYYAYGEFTTSEGAIEGNWEVTVPLSEMN